MNAATAEQGTQGFLSYAWASTQPTQKTVCSTCSGGFTYIQAPLRLSHGMTRASCEHVTCTSHARTQQPDQESAETLLPSWPLSDLLPPPQAMAAGLTVPQLCSCQQPAICPAPGADFLTTIAQAELSHTPAQLFHQALPQGLAARGLYKPCSAM